MSCKYNYNGKWYTEQELLQLPEFKEQFASQQIERNYVNNNTGINTEDAIYYFSPNAQAGIFTKFIQFKRSQITEYQKRLNKVEVEKKKRDVSPDRLKQLNRLERELNLQLEGNFELGIKGLREEVLELEKNANIDAVGYYTEKDLGRLKNLVDSNNIDDLQEAQRIIDFYYLAGTFMRNIENPFFTQEEIFLEDSNGNLTTEYRLSDSTMQKFKDWKDRALFFQNTIEKAKEDLTVNTINSNESVQATYGDKKFSYDEIVHTDRGLKDTDWVSMWTMDITQGLFSTNGIIPQVMFSYLSNSFEKKLSWARQIEEKIDKLTPEVQSELIKMGYSLRGAGILGIKGASYQLFKEITKEGNETGGIIQRFVKEFYNAQSSVLNKFSERFNASRAIPDYNMRAAAFNKAFEELKKWRRTNTIIVDIANIPELVSDPEFIEIFKGVATNTDPNHKQYLLDILGQKGYNEQVTRQARQLRKYISEKQSTTETLLIMENVSSFDQLSDKAKSDLSYWDSNHSPFRGVEDYNSVSGVFFGNRKSNNFMDYNVFVPRKFKPTITINENKYLFTDTTDETGYYSKDFAKIESNPKLSEFYDVLKEIVDTTREVMPYELQQKMAVNTLPGLKKSSAEIIADKNTGILSALFLGFKNLIERIRLGFGVVKQSEISYATIDPATGRINYKINDQFLQSNARSVQERMDIEKAKFISAYGQGLVNVRRFTIIPLAQMTTESLILLSQYTNVDISLAEIQARKLDKIKAVTGNSVEIGKYIRDFSLHSVVQSQSFDLAKVGKYFANMAMAYSARQEALPILEIMKQHYESIKKPKTNNLGTGIYNANTETYMKDGIRTNAMRQMDDWFERVVLDNYGGKQGGVHGLAVKEEVDKDGNVSTKIPFYAKKIFSTEEKHNVRDIDKLLNSPNIPEDLAASLKKMKEGWGKERTATALFDNFLAFIRTLRLGYNISSATTNFLEGVTSNVILSAQGEYFDPKEIFYGYHVMKSSFVKNATFGLWETKAAKKNRKLMDKFNVIMDSKNELQKSSVRTYANKLSWLNPHELNQRVEFVNQSPIMIAMLRTLKIKDKSNNESSIWEAMLDTGHLKEEFRTEENIKNWEQLTGEDYLNFKQKLHKAIVLGHGNYHDLRGMMIKSHTAGKALMMFKTWVPMQFYWRFGVEQDDIQSGRKGVRGRYWSYGAGSGATHLGVIGLSVFGPLGAVAGGALGAFLGGNFGTDSGVGFLKQIIETNKQLLKKVIGMPVNTLSVAVAGKRLVNTGDKAFEDWVGKGRFTEQDAKNMRGNIADLSLQLAWLGLILLAKSMFWDDDDEPDDPDRIAHNIMVNKLMQLSSQGAMYVSPPDAFKSTIGSNGTIQYFTDVAKELTRVSEYLHGRDIIQSGINAGESGLWNQTKKSFLPGIFKDKFFGFETQAEKVFDESPFHPYFKSEATIDKEDNKRDRAERRLELESILDADDFEGDDVKERTKAKDKEIRRILNEEYPTPTKLKKLDMTREEYEEQRSND